MKKINAMDIMSNIPMNAKIKSVIASHFTGFQLGAIIRENNKKALMEIKGVGPITAQLILDHGAEYLKGKDMEPECNIAHYYAPMYNIDMFLSDYEKSLLASIKDLYDIAIPEDEHMKRRVIAETTEQLVQEIDMFAQYEAGRINLPMRAMQQPDQICLAESMLSDRLGIVPGDQTNQIVLLDHGADDFAAVDGALRMAATFRDLEGVNAALANLRSMIMRRFTYSGFHAADGTKFMFFTCSTGQLKKGSGYWMREDVIRNHPEFFWFGMSPKAINESGRRLVMTRLLQFRALLTSSAIPSRRVLGHKMKLRNCICIKEVEKTMEADVKSVTADYKVVNGRRSDIVNNIADGWFIMNMRVFGNVVAQSRFPLCKGLGVSLDYLGYCEEMGYEPVLTDVDGVEHDLRKEDVHIILNTSVWKGKKFFGSWKKFVECMELCGFDEFYICAVDEDHGRDKTISRQMFGSLFDVTDKEMANIASMTAEHLRDYFDLDKATDMLGENWKDYSKRSNMAKLVSAYPEVMSLPFAKEELQMRYTSERNEALTGKLMVNGRYFFVISDPLAFMDVVFGHRDPSDPTIGYLKANECVCSAYPKANELILLRNPHAFMEWVVANNRKANKYLCGCAIYTSVHDLNFRVLQMDYDGDHLLVINNRRMVDAVKRIKETFNIPVVYYEPTEAADPAPFGENRRAFAEQVVECIMNCIVYNKVGPYSNLVTEAWAQFDKNMSPKELNELMDDIAIIASGINHAVDAQKTYALKELPSYIKKRYGFKTFSEQFKDPNGDWDRSKMRPMRQGSVDRLIANLHGVLEEQVVLDTSKLNFNYMMLKDTDKECVKAVRSAPVSKNVLDLLSTYHPKEGSYDEMLLNQAKAGDRVMFYRFMRLVYHANTDFFSRFKDMESDRIEQMRADQMRIDVTRQIAMDFVRNSFEDPNMSKDRALRIAAWSMLADTFGPRYNGKNEKNARFIFDVFGDVYADNVMKNIAAGIEVESDDAFDAEIVPQQPDFDPDAYDAPPAEYDVALPLYNEMDDVY